MPNSTRKPVRAWGIRSRHGSSLKKIVSRVRAEACEMASVLEEEFDLPAGCLLDSLPGYRGGLTDETYKLACRVKWYLIRRLEERGYDSEVITRTLGVSISVIYKGRRELDTCIEQDLVLKKGLLNVERQMQ